jgi:hypothetical protein
MFKDINVAQLRPLFKRYQCINFVILGEKKRDIRPIITRLALAIDLLIFLGMGVPPHQRACAIHALKLIDLKIAQNHTHFFYDIFCGPLDISYSKWFCTNINSNISCPRKINTRSISQNR